MGDFQTEPLTTVDRRRVKVAEASRHSWVDEGDPGEGAAPDAGICVVVDVAVKSAGVTDAVNSLAFRRFRYDADGVITRVDRPYHWCENLDAPPFPELARPGRLGDEGMVEMRIDVEAASRLLNSATVICAPTVQRLRPLIEAALPAICVAQWLCASRDIEPICRELGCLGIRADCPSHSYWLGKVDPEHNVNAIIDLLRHRVSDGRTAMSVMLERETSPARSICCGFTGCLPIAFTSERGNREIDVGEGKQRICAETGNGRN